MLPVGANNRSPRQEAGGRSTHFTNVVKSVGLTPEIGLTPLHFRYYILCYSCTNAPLSTYSINCFLQEILHLYDHSKQCLMILYTGFVVRIS